MKSFKRHIAELSQPGKEAGVGFFDSALINARYTEEVEALMEGLYSLVSGSRAGIYADQVDNEKIEAKGKEIDWLVYRIVPMNRMSDKGELTSVLALETVSRLIQRSIFDFSGLEKVQLLSNLCQVCDSGSKDAREIAEKILDRIDNGADEEGPPGLQLYLQGLGGGGERSIKPLDRKGGLTERICLTLVGIWKNQAFILANGNERVLEALGEKLKEAYLKCSQRAQWELTGIPIARDNQLENLTEQMFLASCPTPEELSVYNAYKMLEARLALKKSAVPA